MKKLVLMIIPVLICGMVFTSCNRKESSNEEGSNDKDWTNKTEELYKYNKDKISITEGIWGTLVQIEGNCMPTTSENSSCKQYPIKREIVIYEYTTLADVVESPTSLPFFEKVYTKLIATTISDNEGFFQVKLAPGKYSIFVKEKQLLYANTFGEQGGISPIIIEPSKVSENNLNIDYAAW
jgi:hypothetical protein